MSAASAEPPATEPSTEPPEPPERPDDEEEGEDDLAAAGYAQIGFNSGAESEEDDEDEDDEDAEAPERTGHSEELETGALDDRVRASEDASAAAQPEAAAQGWVQFGAEDDTPPPPPPGGAATATPIVLRGAMDHELASRQEPPRDVPSTTTVAAAPAAGAPTEDGWTQGGFEGGFEDDDWAAAAESFVAASSGVGSGGGAPAPQGGAAWEADFEEPVTCDTPPLPEEQVELIKQTMAALDIAPPPWVRRMQQLQKVQQMQAALQQALPAAAADGDVPAAPQFRPDEAWVQQMQQHAGAMPGARLLSAATIAAASPFSPAEGGPGAGGAPTSLSGVPVGPKRVSAKQLAAERRKEREERKKRAGAAGR